LDVGYRHVDTAVRYGKRLRSAGVAGPGCRARQCFWTTKVWHDSLRHDQVIASLRDSLSRVAVDYVDLFLVHWPTPRFPLERNDGRFDGSASRGWVGTLASATFTACHIATVKDVIGAPIVIIPGRASSVLVRASDELMRSKEMVVEAYQPLPAEKVMKDPTIL